ncbi:hypothetical protein HF086_001855 [Spodoptera exigua]|uniref:Farnesyl pyrophosphate synthase n=1 Tax=Spodoptera exigua TaxID=7107 RepID=A0A922SCA7_SPOEX|nr:hypothetical protein HF086_001855 [Spodoptera exigua]
MIATVFFRKMMFYNQCRMLHKTAINYSATVTFDRYKNQKKFSDVQSELVSSLMSSPKLKDQMPDVKNWISRIESYVLTVDDIVDSSQTRRGKECWHIHSGVGLGAVNDCGLLLSCAFELLEIYFGNEQIYSDLVKITNQTVIQMCIGQHLDCLYVYRKEKNDFDKLIKNQIEFFDLVKPAVYSFKFPILLALALVKDRSITFSEEAYNVDLNIGRLLHLQNDYKDVFVDDIKTGKVGTDIQEGKLTWFSLTALQRCTEEQRSIFKESYGSSNPEDVKRIKQLFDDLDLKNLYKQNERSMYEDLVQRIRDLPTKEETQFFTQILDGCYKHFC